MLDVPLRPFLLGKRLVRDGVVSIQVFHQLSTEATVPVGLCLDMRPLGAVAFARSSRRPSKVAVRLGTGGGDLQLGRWARPAARMNLFGVTSRWLKKRHAP